MIRRVLMTSLLSFTACGGSDSKGVDAPQGGSDAPATTVKKVDCAAMTPAATVVADDTNNKFVPQDTPINQGQVVQFMVAGDHPIGPNPSAGMSDTGLVVPGNSTTCLQFTATGTFHFRCTIHGFVGTITVN